MKRPIILSVACKTHSANALQNILRSTSCLTTCAHNFIGTSTNIINRLVDFPFNLLPNAIIVNVNQWQDPYTSMHQIFTGTCFDHFGWNTTRRSSPMMIDRRKCRVRSEFPIKKQNKRFKLRLLYVNKKPYLILGFRNAHTRSICCFTGLTLLLFQFKILRNATSKIDRPRKGKMSF